MTLERFALVLTATAFMTLPSSSDALAAASCEMHQVASISATLSASNELLVDVVINDTPTKIQVDTGATTSVLSEKFARRIGMPIETMPGVVYGLSGQALDQMTRIRSLKLGDTVSANEAFALMPAGGDGTNGDSVGLFAADYLQNYDVEIDVAGGKVNLFKQDHCAGRVVYWAPEYFKTKIYYPGPSPLHRPMLDIMVDGKPLRALLDTGAYMNIMRMAVARDRFDLTPDSAEMPKAGETTGVEGRKIETYWHAFQSMTFGDITLHNTKMLIAPIDTAAHVAAIGSHLKQASADEPDMFIGMNLLKQLHLFIAYSENALYYTLAAPKQAANQ